MAYENLLATVYLLLGVLTTLLGLVILRESPASRLSRVTALMLFFAGVGALLGGGSLWAVRAAPDSPWLRSTVVTNFAYLWEFFFPSLLLFAATFPREHPWLRRHGWSDLVIFLPHTIHFFLMFFGTVWGGGAGIEGAAGQIPAAGGLLSIPRVALGLFYTWHRHLFSLVNLSYVALSIFWIARNLMRAEAASIRSQLRTILVGIGVGLLLYVVAAPVNVLLGLHLGGVTAATLLVLALAVCSGTIAYAMVRHRFLDARWIVRRTILYALASAVIVGVYLRVVRQIGTALASTLPVPPGVLDWVALVVPLVFFQPMMGRLEESMEGILLRRRGDLRVVMRRLSSEMSRSLDFEPIARGLCRDLADALSAGRAALLLRSDRSGSNPEYVVEGSTGYDARVLGRLLPLASHLPAAAGDARPLGARDWVEAAVRAGRAEEAADRSLAEDAPALTFELRHGDDRLGFYLLGRKLTGMRYGGEEIALIGTLMNQVGVARKNSLLHRETLGKAVLEEELALARKIQQAFLPSRFPSGLPFEVHGLNLPSKQVGGDYFDFFPLPDGTYALAIADVSGKGVPAALLASMLQASLRTLLREGVSPARIFERVNRLVCESTTPDQFITAFVGRFDPRRRTLTYCNAGHNYPIHHRPAAGASLLSESDLLLGIDEAMTYREHSLKVEPGDTLLLYTDGVTEARDADDVEFGEERLESLLAGLERCSAEEGIEEIRQAVLRFADAGELLDDMTLLLLRIPPALESPRPEAEAFALGETPGGR